MKLRETLLKDFLLYSLIVNAAKGAKSCPTVPRLSPVAGWRGCGRLHPPSSSLSAQTASSAEESLCCCRGNCPHPSHASTLQDSTVCICMYMYGCIAVMCYCACCSNFWSRYMYMHVHSHHRLYASVYACTIMYTHVHITSSPGHSHIFINVV